MINRRSWFVTGTDTGAGKTVASVMLLRAFRAAGHIAHGMKPVASGCMRTDAGLVSDDALLLIGNSSSHLPYEQVNPVALETPCSPNIAATLEGIELDPEAVVRQCRELQGQPGMLIIEGIGGWRTPVFRLSGMDVLVRQLQIPVVLVVGLRLGCLNHACMTLECLRNDGVELAGWIVNQVDPDYIAGEQTVSCLREVIGSEPLGHIPFLSPEHNPGALLRLDIDRLLHG